MRQQGSLLIVIVMMVGIVLVYSAVKGKDPRDVIKGALKGGK